MLCGYMTCKLTMTFSPVNRVGASVSRPYSSAHAGAATPPRANAAARAELDRISRREVLMLFVHVFEVTSSSLPFVAEEAASAVLGHATRGFRLAVRDTVEKASAEAAVKRAQRAAPVTDLRLGAAILKLEK